MIRTYLRLLLNFIKSLLASGWGTAAIILRRGEPARSGVVELSYQDLSPAQASIVGALITLAPGTTTVAIDTRQRRFTLHLLDLANREALERDIQRDLIAPLQSLNRSKP